MLPMLITHGFSASKNSLGAGPFSPSAVMRQLMGQASKRITKMAAEIPTCNADYCR